MEEHLIKCNECREKLSYIRNYMEENDEREQIELDYLKKIRIKTRIKSVLIAIGIIGILKRRSKFAIIISINYNFLINMLYMCHVIIKFLSIFQNIAMQSFKF